MVRVTQCNTLVFLPELNSRENFPPGGGVGGSISAPNNDEFKHGAVVYGYIGAGYWPKAEGSSLGLTWSVDEVIKRWLNAD